MVQEQATAEVSISDLRYCIRIATITKDKIHRVASASEPDLRRLVGLCSTMDTIFDTVATFEQTSENERGEIQESPSCCGAFGQPDHCSEPAQREVGSSCGSLGEPDTSADPGFQEEQVLHPILYAGLRGATATETGHGAASQPQPLPPIYEEEVEAVTDPASEAETLPPPYEESCTPGMVVQSVEVSEFVDDHEAENILPHGASDDHNHEESPGNCKLSPKTCGSGSPDDKLSADPRSQPCTTSAQRRGYKRKFVFLRMSLRRTYQPLKRHFSKEPVS